jgi:hypothetical protein
MHSEFCGPSRVEKGGDNESLSNLANVLLGIEIAIAHLHLTTASRQ